MSIFIPQMEKLSIREDYKLLEQPLVLQLQLQLQLPLEEQHQQLLPLKSSQLMEQPLDHL